MNLGGELVINKARLVQIRSQLNSLYSSRNLNYLIDEGFNPDYGARPLKRAIERLLEDPLSEGLLRGEFKKAKVINISLKDKALLFEPIMEDEKPVGAVAESGGESEETKKD